MKAQRAKKKTAKPIPRTVEARSSSALVPSDDCAALVGRVVTIAEGMVAESSAEKQRAAKLAKPRRTSRSKGGET
ncbi:MAG TPA: hypothetical protein VMJ10_35985 [Kofleriaceae bacterium]|nr:hypothetical protein [Kofleriaceae bacterium]